jgi:enoyl-CoA hydratase
MAEYKSIEVTRDKKIVIATLKTGLKIDAVRELTALFESLAADETTAAIVISGDFTSDVAADDMAVLCEAVESLPRPVIAAIAGAAQGPGFELALACDLRVASETARFGFPGTGGGPALRLAKMVGLARAKHMALTGQIIDALEAERMGLISHAAAAPEVPLVAKKLARTVASRASRK